MKIENAKWHTDLEGNNIAILCTKDGQPMVHIPIDENNTDDGLLLDVIEGEGDKQKISSKEKDDQQKPGEFKKTDVNIKINIVYNKLSDHLVKKIRLASNNGRDKKALEGIIKIFNDE